MGYYRQLPRTATVIAEEPSAAYRLTRQAFDRMQAQDPVAASVFHKLIIRLLFGPARILGSVAATFVLALTPVSGD